jgi:2-polyprenyl-6-methoxyphenol hydroxylase-like FAD-dependent oxidoreductase
MTPTLRVAIIGAGPAGTFCALSLLRCARVVGRDLGVPLFDRNVFSIFGPRGCAMGAGVASHTPLRAVMRAAGGGRGRSAFPPPGTA